MSVCDGSALKTAGKNASTSLTIHLSGSRHEELTLQLELAEELGSAFRASSLRGSGAPCQERGKRQETHETAELTITNT